MVKVAVAVAEDGLQSTLSIFECQFYLITAKKKTKSETTTKTQNDRANEVPTLKCKRNTQIRLIRLLWSVGLSARICAAYVCVMSFFQLNKSCVGLPRDVGVRSPDGSEIEWAIDDDKVEWLLFYFVFERVTHKLFKRFNSSSFKLRHEGHIHFCLVIFILFSIRKINRTSSEPVIFHFSIDGANANTLLVNLNAHKSFSHDPRLHTKPIACGHLRNE